MKDTRNFLNSLNKSNDGISKMFVIKNSSYFMIISVYDEMFFMFNYRPKTFMASQIKYNQIELYCPEGQDRFFVDFNKWTISTTIKSTEV